MGGQAGTSEGIMNLSLFGVFAAALMFGIAAWAATEGLPFTTGTAVFWGVFNLGLAVRNG